MMGLGFNHSVTLSQPLLDQRDRLRISAVGVNLRTVAEATIASGFEMKMGYAKECEIRRERGFKSERKNRFSPSGIENHE